MSRYFLEKLLIIIPIFFELGNPILFAQNQDFESSFQPSSYPEEFLPNWYGNEVRATSARIFQVSNQGRNGSKGLAVQPISTFDGKIWIKLTPAHFENPELLFFAKTIQNGSGNRPALVFYSWGRKLDGEFSEPIQIGNNTEFPNSNQEFRRYNITLPSHFKSEEEVFLSLDIRYGPGSGSAARWIMDDFEFGDIVRDESPPRVISAKGYDSNSVFIQFSERVDPVFSIFSIAYELEDENPISVQLKSDSLVIATFERKLESAKSYGLSIRQIPDLEGNFLEDTTVTFTFFDPTDIPEKSLVINELMPAPRADQDLPNVEYIELFHAGDHEFRLGGLKLSNSRSTAILSEFWLNPGEYLILAPENQAAQLASFGKVLPIKSWPTLLNSGDQVFLSSASGMFIDRISYFTSTWGGNVLANGGYSLEVPNPFFLCDNSAFLTPSIDKLRGTPGIQNSIFDPKTELVNLKIESAFFVDSKEILVAFSSPILPKFDKENISFTPVLKADTLIFVSTTEIRLILETPAEENSVYRLVLDGFKDCFGNEIGDLSINLVLPEIPEKGELIINEVLFDPRTGDPKFVEVKNTTEKYLNLENLALANINSAGLPDQLRVFGKKGLVLEPKGYLAITTATQALKLAYPKSIQGNFLQIPTLPSYPIAGGTVVLLFSGGEIAETFKYDKNLHHPLLRNPKGVSLERISDQSPTTLSSNWQSASGNEDYATPGRKNSQALDIEFEAEIIQIDPEVFDPEGSSGPAFTSIRYQLDMAGWVGTFKIYSAAGQLIQTLAQNQILGTNGMFTWTGTDSTGKLVRAGYYVLVAELYELGGKTKVFKKTIVVATRL
ncbi:MAG: hypothetical protein C0433_12585 [Cyclobacterium sp.]|nr:hypothetical protein [Cyclobacterium sp.]